MSLSASRHLRMCLFHSRVEMFESLDVSRLEHLIVPTCYFLMDKLLWLDIGLLRDNECHDQVDNSDPAEACEER